MPATVSRSRWISHSALNITPRSSLYWSPGSTSIVQRGSRSRLRTFCDLAYVHDQHSPSRTTYQSGIRCGQPSVPTVAHVSVRSSERKASTSSPLIAIGERRLTSRRSGDEPFGGGENRLAGVGGFEHDRVARLLQ